MGDLFDGGEIDAVVITGTFFGDPRTGWLLERDVPFVSFGRPWGGDDVYRSAHTGSTSTAPPARAPRREHALATAGPRVGFVGWPPDAGTGDDRERGWREAMADAGAAGPRFETVDGLGAARHAMTAAFADAGGPAATSTRSCASATRSLSARTWRRRMPGGGSFRSSGSTTPPSPRRMGISSVEQSPELVAGRCSTC